MLKSTQKIHSKYKVNFSEIIRVLDKNGTDFKELVDKKLAELKKQSKYQDKSAEELLRIADSEVIADGCETMLQNSKLFENLIEGNPGIGKKIINAIKKVIDQIRGYFKDYPKLAKTEYGQAVLDAMEKTENDIQALYDKAVAEGIKATNAGTAENNAQLNDRATQFNYDTLIKKPDMKIVKLGNEVYNRADTVFYAKKNAAKIGKRNSKNEVSVFVDDLGSDVILTDKGIRHGLTRKMDLISPVTVRIGEILKQSIKVNELNPKNPNASHTYVLIGSAQTKNGELVFVRSLVNQFDNKLESVDVLYAVNAKKESAATVSPSFAKNSLPVTDSTISISDLLDNVNKHYPDILPESVLRHFNYESRPDGVLGESALFSDRFGDRVIIDDLLDDYGDSDRVKLARAMKNLAKNDFERSAIKRYQDNVAKLDAAADELIEVNKKIKELTFTKDADRSQLSKLREQKAKLENKIAWWDKKLITTFETAKPLRDLFARGRKEVERKQKVKSDKRFKDYKDWQKKRAVILGQGARISKLYH